MIRYIVLSLLAVAVCGAPAARADLIVFGAILTGPAEAPPNASPGFGIAIVEYDSVAHTLHVQATFHSLTAPTTVAHIHAPTAVPFTGTAAVATTLPTFPGFPAGVTAGVYDNTST